MCIWGLKVTQIWHWSSCLESSVVDLCSCIASFNRHTGWIQMVMHDLWGLSLLLTKCSHRSVTFTWKVRKKHSGVSKGIWLFWIKFLCSFFLWKSNPLLLKGSSCSQKCACEVQKWPRFDIEVVVLNWLLWIFAAALPASTGKKDWFEGWCMTFGVVPTYHQMFTQMCHIHLKSEKKHQGLIREFGCFGSDFCA